MNNLNDPSIVTISKSNTEDPVAIARAAVSRRGTGKHLWHERRAKKCAIHSFFIILTGYQTHHYTDLKIDYSTKFSINTIQ
jgi:hypothetical protein